MATDSALEPGRQGHWKRRLCSALQLRLSLGLPLFGPRQQHFYKCWSALSLSPIISKPLPLEVFCSHQTGPSDSQGLCPNVLSSELTCTCSHSCSVLPACLVEKTSCVPSLHYQTHSALPQAPLPASTSCSVLAPFYAQGNTFKLLPHWALPRAPAPLLSRSLPPLRHSPPRALPCGPGGPTS